MVKIVKQELVGYDGDKKPVFYVEGTCESGDTKPTDVGANSLFAELDTGDVYYFDGSDWQVVGG